MVLISFGGTAGLMSWSHNEVKNTIWGKSTFSVDFLALKDI